MNGCNGGGVCKCVPCNLNYKIPEDLSTEKLECLVLEFVFRFIVISIFFFKSILQEYIFFFKSIHEFKLRIHIERYN